MAKRRIIAGLDMGNSKIRVAVGLVEGDREVNIIGVGVSPSNGLRKGNVIDVAEAVRNISTALEDAERMAGEPIHHVHLGISGDHITGCDNRSIISISHQGNEIIEDDVNRVMEAVRDLNLPSNRTILRVLPRYFTVDEQVGIRHPLGMTGTRLAVLAHLISGLAPTVKNLEKCVHQSGVDIDEVHPCSLMACEAVLTKKQKDLGVVLIDIGAGGTGVVVYEESSVLHSANLPVGGDNVTNDIAIGLRTSIETADKIKLEYGTCNPDDVHDRETIDLSILSKIDSSTISKKHLAEIIQARYQEIFLMVRDELAKVQRDGMLPSGAVLVGSGVKMPGLIDLAKETLHLPVQIGFPSNYQGVVDKIEDPSYAGVIGLTIYGASAPAPSYGIQLSSLKDFSVERLVQGLKAWFRSLMT